MSDNPLLKVREFGQSIWCDDINRCLLLSGLLTTLVENDGVSGITSNPSIFHKSITGTSDYDEEFVRLVSQGADTGEILETLMIQDIRLAADVLRPLWESTETVDGWVSIEVAPSLAHDAEATMSEVKRVYALVDRPNVLVKVPATQQGVEAFRHLTADGYSINVTLIFAIERYRAIVNAYIEGLEELIARRGRGETRPDGRALPAPGEVRSVASFFVSRVDTLIDKWLEARAIDADESSRAWLLMLRGKAAVANAKLAYVAFCQAFSGERWKALAATGARVQRPLWASTSTKNPAYSDVLYVEELIGTDTVNTMPLSTMAAFRDHGRAEDTLTRGHEEARAHIREIEATGISMTDVTARLEKEGVQAFADSFDALYAALEEKRAAPVSTASEGRCDVPR